MVGGQGLCFSSANGIEPVSSISGLALFQYNLQSPHLENDVVSVCMCTFAKSSSGKLGGEWGYE